MKGWPFREGPRHKDDSSLLRILPKKKMSVHTVRTEYQNNNIPMNVTQTLPCKDIASQIPSNTFYLSRSLKLCVNYALI